MRRSDHRFQINLFEKLFENGRQRKRKLAVLGPVD
jgi:hypothetical protein